MLPEPAVQHIGVHPVLAGQCRNGHARMLAGRNQIGFELGRVCPVGAPGRIIGDLGIFEHSVHDELRAHDLARQPASIQHGFTVRIQRVSYFMHYIT